MQLQINKLASLITRVEVDLCIIHLTVKAVCILLISDYPTLNRALTELYFGYTSGVYHLLVVNNMCQNTFLNSLAEVAISPLQK